jgi:hypothetical protein
VSLDRRAYHCPVSLLDTVANWLLFIKIWGVRNLLNPISDGTFRAWRQVIELGDIRDVDTDGGRRRE